MTRSWLSSVMAAVGRLRADTRGGVALIGALSLTSIVGMGAFAVEATRGYAADANNQRVADMAALAGALAYNVNSNMNQATATAKAVVAAQGIAASAATVGLVTDAATSKQLIQVTITTPVPLALGRVFTSALSYDVTASGSASISATSSVTPPCVTALDQPSNYGVRMNGGARLTATGCAINANAGVEVPEGTYITAKQVTSGKTVYNPGSGLTTSPTANNIIQNKANAATDWMKDDAGVMAMLCQVNLLTGYSDPDYPGGNRSCTSKYVAPSSPSTSGAANWTLGYKKKTDGTPHQYQTADYSCQYQIPAGTYTIGKLTVAGGCTISFANGSTLKFDSIDMSGSSMTVGDGSFTVVGTFGFNSGTTITIGNGNHDFGKLSITGGRTLNIGSGNLNVQQGIYLDGGSNVYVASIAGDRITIGNDGGSGRSIEISGGSRVCFTLSCGNPVNAVTTFSLGGSVKTSGGSTIVFPKAETHIIKGDIDLNGSSIFGAGTYIASGYFSNNTGGTMSGSDVSFALGDKIELSGGTSLDLAAPSASSSYGVPGVLIATKTSSNLKFGGGSANKYAGLVYAPKARMVVEGGASISASGSACLMMIVDELEIKDGGTISVGSCSALSTAGPTAAVALFK